MHYDNHFRKLTTGRNAVLVLADLSERIQYAPDIENIFN